MTTRAPSFGLEFSSLLILKSMLGLHRLEFLVLFLYKVLTSEELTIKKGNERKRNIKGKGRKKNTTFLPPVNVSKGFVRICVSEVVLPLFPG